MKEQLTIAQKQNKKLTPTLFSTNQTLTYLNHPQSSNDHDFFSTNQESNGCVSVRDDEISNLHQEETKNPEKRSNSQEIISYCRYLLHRPQA